MVINLYGDLMYANVFLSEWHSFFSYLVIQRFIYPKEALKCMLMYDSINDHHSLTFLNEYEITKCFACSMNHHL